MDTARPALVVLSLLTFLVLAPAQSLASGNVNPLKIGVSSMITPVSAVRYYQEIIDYIGEQLQQPVVMVHRRSYAEMDDLLRRGEVKVAFICSMPYVRNHHEFGVELLVAPRVEGKAEYYSYIIVHKDSSVSSFGGLKGKGFVFTDPKSNTGRLYPTYLLKTMKSTPEKFFSRTAFSYSHNKSIELVAKRKADSAAVDSLVYDYMVKTGSPYTKQTKIIKRSEAFGIPPVVVTADIDSQIKDRIRKALLEMHRTEKGRDILRAMMIDDFVLIADGEYDSIREMERVVSDGNPSVGKGSGR